MPIGSLLSLFWFACPQSFCFQQLVPKAIKQLLYYYLGVLLLRHCFSLILQISIRSCPMHATNTSI